MTTPAPIARMTSDLVREMRAREAFNAVYDAIDPITTTRHTAWLCWQAARASLAPAPQPASALAAVREPLSGEQIDAAFIAAGGRWNGNFWVIEDADFHPFVRGITAQAQQEGGR